MSFVVVACCRYGMAGDRATEGGEKQNDIYVNLAPPFYSSFLCGRAIWHNTVNIKSFLRIVRTINVLITTHLHQVILFKYFWYVDLSHMLFQIKFWVCCSKTSTTVPF